MNQHPRHPVEILLLTSVPLAHEGLVRGLRTHGLAVRVATGFPALLRRPRRGHMMLLVDLVHGAGLDRRAVDRLNRARGNAVVVALHEGELGPAHEAVADLSVDGFCRADEWRSIAGLAGASSHAVSTQLH